MIDKTAEPGSSGHLRAAAADLRRKSDPDRPAEAADRLRGAKSPPPPASTHAAPAAGKPAAAPAGAASQASDTADDSEQLHASWFKYRAAASFGTSMIVHFALLLIMAMWVITPVVKTQLEELVATEVRPQEELSQVLEEKVTPSQTLSVESSGGGGLVQTAMAGGHGAALQSNAAPQMDKTVTEVAEGPQVALSDVNVFAVSGTDLKMDVGEGAPGDAAAVVDGYQEAMDRITQEILMMLLKNDVLVLWLFDESESMKDDQKELRERVYRVYEELGLAKEAAGDRLLTSIGSYGKEFRVLTERPTNDLNKIKAAIDAVPNDPSGKEYQCPAVGQLIEAHRKYASGGRRKLAVIMVTDESGEYDDNVQNLEKLVTLAKETRTTVYILGREAVFGYPYAYMSWTDVASGLGFWLQINRGPETPDPEQLQTNGFYRRYDAHASGFGPYEQSRLARETGGVFFLLPSPEVNLVARDDRKYALQAMRPYLPDLGRRDVYAQERDESELRSTLWKVITDLNPYNPKVQPHIEMRHVFSIDPSARQQQMAEEHERAKRYFLYLHEAEDALEKIKPRRQAEVSARWRANYDLIYAQIVAYKVRLYDYGAYLEQFAKNPKPLKNPYKNAQGFPVQSTHWEITTRQEMLTLETTQAYLEKSKAMFQQVVQEHAGTPWSARAEWEVARGFGVELVEAYDDPRRASLGIKLPNL
jgi:hypothetical protein